jgi:hypothetical protein
MNRNAYKDDMVADRVVCRGVLAESTGKVTITLSQAPGRTVTVAWFVVD